MVERPRHLYWDCTCFGRGFPDGIGRFTIALAQRVYALPSVFLLPPFLADGPLHRALASSCGNVRVMADHPRRRYPWRWYWDQVLEEPGVIFAPGNFHRPVRRWPTVVAVHDLIPYLDADYRPHAHTTPRAYRRLLTDAREVIAVSTWTASSITAWCGRSQGMTVIRQGLFPQPPVSPPSWLPATPYYLFVGGSEPRKRLEAAIDCAERLADAALVVVGHDWPDRSVAALTATWRGRHPCIHRSAVDEGELAALYAGCRALLYPTRMEGFGLPGLEVLRAGRPVVASRLSALPETLGDHAIWHDFAPLTDPADLRARIDAWRPGVALAAHLATCSWTTAGDSVAAVIARVAAE